MTTLFDLAETPVESGVTFVEAGAGTGKTYAIAGLVVRLILEQSLPIQQILVVTFTEAATDELRGRVRSRVAEALRALEENNDNADPALATFAKGAGPDERLSGIKRLRLALLSFDEAAIFTIHGFCQRTLRENAFETGSPFDVELLTNPLPLWQQCIEDFHRRQTSAADDTTAVILTHLRTNGTLSETKLFDLLSQLTRHPELVILEDEETGTEADFPRPREVLEDTARAWAETGAEVAGLLRGHPGLSRNQHAFREDRVDQILTELESWQADGAITPATLAALLPLAAENVAANTKARAKEKPHHPFFDHCQLLLNTVLRIGRNYRREFTLHARNGLEVLKREQNLVTFDDLLTRMAQGLDGPGGPVLANAIGQTYGAALIDEFQDTDPIQWRIFRGIFANGNHVLFLIGDPKQAIYSFRGADIFTYMEAKREARRVHTMSKNWRSDRPLIEGVNSLFRQSDNPFVFEEIGYEPAVAARGEGGFRGADGTLCRTPLRLVPVTGDDGENLNVGKAADRILRLVTAEIQTLLQSGCHIPNTTAGTDRPVEPGDIAVLTRKNREAEDVRTALATIGVPAVIRTDQSVLATPEAEHLLTWMAAVLEPGRSGLIKSALSTPLFGFDAGALDGLDSDESAWQTTAEPFFIWREIWFRHGFIRLFRRFCNDQPIRARLLANPDGERVLTNIQHAAECLHRAEHDSSLNPPALVRWLREERAQELPGDDSHLIRLEKDEQAVQIVTIHRSKGLEYPVVFVPFNWTNVLPRTADPVFHDPANHNRLTWDMRQAPSAESKAAFEQEQLAESLRLLYVAVTRARHRCYLYWAATRDSGQPDRTPLAWLHRTTGEALAPADAFQALSGEPGTALHSTPLDQTSRSFPRSGGVDCDPRARPFSRRLLSGKLITSFSTLTAAGKNEEADRDTHIPIPAGETTGDNLERSLFNFPKGVRAGNFFHSLLEVLDFADPRNLAQLVEEGLVAHGMEREFAPVVEAAVLALLDTPLPNGPRLGELPAADRKPEIAFTYPVRRVTPAELEKITGGCGSSGLADSLGRLVYSPEEGYLTGFIDLVFRYNGKYHVADWKSNWLGSADGDYQTGALERAMAAGHYHLQYHLYTLALHRRLRQTVPGYRYEEHFGGVYYLFLRGIDPKHPGGGVFHDLPPAKRIHDLEQLLLGDVPKEEPL